MSWKSAPPQSIHPTSIAQTKYQLAICRGRSQYASNRWGGWGQIVGKDFAILIDLLDNLPPARRALAKHKRRHRVNINEPGHAHELTFSCYHRFKFLKSERTCQWLAGAIENARSELSFLLWAYVFMPDHAHLLIFPTQPIYDIADIRSAIKSPVARRAIRYMKATAPAWLPKITRKRGDQSEHLFWQSGGGYDRNVTSSKVLLASIDYLHLNPVRKGLVESAADWKWSSAAWYINGEATPVALDPIPTEWLERA